MLRDRTVFSRPVSSEAAKLLAVILMFGVLKSAVWAQTPPLLSKPTTTGRAPTRYLPNRLSQHALAYYGAVWGIDAITAKAVESGELIRFSYRALDPQKAKMLNDKTISAFLVAPALGIRLSIPTLEKVQPDCGRAALLKRLNPIGWPFPTQAGE